MNLPDDPAVIIEKWLALHRLLHAAVDLLDQAIHGDAGTLAAKQDVFARFAVFPCSGGLMVAGRVGIQLYVCHRETATPVARLPAGQPVATATYEGDFVRRQTGTTSKRWRVDLAEAWLFHSGYLRLQYEAQKHLLCSQTGQAAAGNPSQAV